MTAERLPAFPTYMFILTAIETGDLKLSLSACDPGMADRHIGAVPLAPRAGRALLTQRRDSDRDRV
jgi:hypothetical protein